MKKSWGLAVVGVALTCSLAGCATPSRFEWGGYEGALYAYAKKPNLRENYRQALVKAVDDGKRTNRLAPGLQAELGYLSLEDGDTAGAVRFFEGEMQAFPESRRFLEGVVARTKGEIPSKKTAVTAS
jgi:hypothetical protein